MDEVAGGGALFAFELKVQEFERSAVSAAD